MKYQFKKLPLTMAIAAMSLGCFCACEFDEDFVIDDVSDIDTEITIFEKGLTVPIGSTAEIKIESVLEKSGIMDGEFKDYIETDKDGSYRLHYAGSYDFAESIAEFNLDQFAHSIPSINYGFNAKTGIAGSDYNFTIPVSSYNQESRLLSKSSFSSYIAAMGDGAYSIPSGIPLTYGFDSINETVDPVTLPSQIKSIKSVEIDSKAAIKVTMSIVNPLIQSGSVTPAITLDIADLFTLNGGSSLDLSSLVLNESNGYKASSSFPISGVNIAKLTSKKSISAAGEISISSDAKTSKAILTNASDDMTLKVNIEVVNLNVKSVGCEINPYTTDINESFDLEVAATEIPEQIKSINDVTFTSDSKLKFTLNMANLDKVSGLSVMLDELKLVFPDAIKVEGDGISGNVMTLKNVNLGTPLSRDITVKSLKVPAPVNGKISYKASIPVTAKASATGTINSKDIPASVNDDIEISAKISGDIAIAKVTATSDYSIKLEEKIPMFDLSILGADRNIEFPEITANFDVTSNISIPLSANVTIGDQSKRLTFPYSEDGKSKTEHNTVTLDINKIINADPAPENIEFKVEASVDPTRECMLNLGDKLELKVDYDVSLPFQLGSGTKISMCDTIKVDGSSIKDIIANNAFGILGTIESTLPLGLEIELSLLSSTDDGKTCTTIPLKKEAAIKVNAGGKSDFEVSIDIADGADMEHLYGVGLNIKADSNGQAIHNNDYIKATLSASLPHGYNVKL